MATLTIVDENTSTQNTDDIKKYLAQEGIAFGTFALNALSTEKAKQDTLSELERVDIINSYPEIVDLYDTHYGYRADMICLYPEFKYLDMVLEKFKDVHFHYEAEHWYYIDGSSGFGFLGRDGRKFTVEIGAGEHITVPEGKWQWVIPPRDNRMKSIRFFTCSQTIPAPEKLAFASI